MDSTQQVLYVKREVTYKVDPVPTSANAVLVEAFSYTRSELKMVERNPIEASKATRQKIYAGSLYTMTFDMEIKGSGAAGTPPECADLLVGAAMRENIVASTSVAYDFEPGVQGSVTIYRYVDGKLLIFSGCRGDWSIKANVHDKMIFSFSFTGHLISEADVAIGSAVYDTTIPSPIVGANFVVDGASAVINSLTVNAGSEVKLATDMNSPNGFGEVVLGKRNVSGSFDPEDDLLAIRDWRSELEINTLMAMSLGPLGATSGNRVSLTLPAISFVGDDEQERENKVTREMNFEAHPTTGNNDIAVTFT